MPNIPTSEIQETEITLENSDGKDETYTLLVFNCPHCNGTLGIDFTYFDQISNEIKCPYCSEGVLIPED